MQSLHQFQPRVKPHIAVIRDGKVYRWRRFDGHTGRVSSAAWLDATAAVTAAKSVAACYSVPFAEVAA